MEPAVEAALATRLPPVFVVGRCQMLRVKAFNGAAECRITVEGRLFSPWASELESAWQQAQRATPGNKIAVDPSGMTFMGSNGKAVLTNVTGQGRKLVARGIYN
jgi:anti-anti-sigma regulatory factor